MRLGTTEILLLIVLAIILFGGSRIAGLGKARQKYPGVQGGSAYGYAGGSKVRG